MQQVTDDQRFLVNIFYFTVEMWVSVQAHCAEQRVSQLLDQSALIK